MREEIKEESQPLVSNNEDVQKSESLVFMYLCYFTVATGSIALGAALAISSPLISDLQKLPSNNSLYLTGTEASWFAGIYLVGGIIGGSIVGVILERFGRKWTSVISALPYLIGLAFIGLADEIWMLYLGRTISGIGAGMSTVIVPVYVGEVSPANLRGMLGAANQTFVVIGVMMMYGLGTILPWRWLCAAAAVVPIALFVLSLFIAETPRYLLIKKENEKARRALQRLRGSNADIEEEFQCLSSNLNETVERATWAEIFTRREIRIPTLLSLGMMYFQQSTGINAVMFYANTVFESAGFTTHSQLTLALMGVSGSQFVFAMISSSLIDRSGRKILLVISGVISCLSLVVFGFYFQILSWKADLQIIPTSSTITENITSGINATVMTSTNAPQTSHLTWMALVSMMVFNGAYFIGIGPIPWILVAEMIPTRARGNAASIVICFNIVLTFALTTSFSAMLKAITSQGTFWFYAGNCALSVLFVIFFIPETKGKTLEEIEAYFQGLKNENKAVNRTDENGNENKSIEH